MHCKIATVLLLSVTGTAMAQGDSSSSPSAVTESAPIRTIQAKWQNKSEIRGGASGTFKFTAQKQSGNTFSGKLDVVGGNCRVFGDPATATVDGDKIQIAAAQSQTSCGVDIDVSRTQRGGKYQFRQFGYSGIVTDLQIE